MPGCLPAAPPQPRSTPRGCPGIVTFILSMLASIFSCSTSLRACAMLAVLLLAIGTPGARGARHGAARRPETPKSDSLGLPPGVRGPPEYLGDAERFLNPVFNEGREPPASLLEQGFPINGALRHGAAPYQNSTTTP